MRHRKKVKKLGRTASHRKALLRNLAAQIIHHHQVKTTLAKAKAARSFVERLITYGKKNTVHARRLAFKHLQNRTLVKQLFDDIAPTYVDRHGGYTRIIKLGPRRGDGAQMAILQLVGFEEVVVEEKTKTKKKARPKRKEKPQDSTAVAEEKEKAPDTVPSEAEGPVAEAETGKKGRKKTAKKENAGTKATGKAGADELDETAASQSLPETGETAEQSGSETTQKRKTSKKKTKE